MKMYYVNFDADDERNEMCLTLEEAKRVAHDAMTDPYSDSLTTATIYACEPVLYATRSVTFTSAVQPETPVARTMEFRHGVDGTTL